MLLRAEQRTVDPVTLCTTLFEIERQRSSDAPTTLALLIAGSRDTMDKKID